MEDLKKHSWFSQNIHLVALQSCLEQKINERWVFFCIIYLVIWLCWVRNSIFVVSNNSESVTCVWHQVLVRNSVILYSSKFGSCFCLPFILIYKKEKKWCSSVIDRWNIGQEDSKEKKKLGLLYCRWQKTMSHKIWLIYYTYN